MFKGLQADAHYTWSRTRDMSTHSNGGGQTMDNYDIWRDYGPANWDTPHRFVASYLYAKGYEGGNGLQEGMRFGVLIGLVMVGYVAGVNYAIMNIGRRMAAAYALAGLVEWVVVGMAIGFVYRPVAKVRAAGAGV
jgi:hypothetical protein